MCLLVQSAALAPAGSPSSDSMRAALSICRRCCHQITQQLGAFAAQSSISLEYQRSHGRTITLPFLRFSNNCNHPLVRRTFIVTFCMHADVYPGLLQDAREPGDHVQDGALHHGCCFVVVSHPVVEVRDMAFHVRAAPCLLNEPAQGCTVRSGPGSPRTCSKVGRNGCVARLAHVPIIAFPQSTRGRCTEP